jgi:hypothetical protein
MHLVGILLGNSVFRFGRSCSKLGGRVFRLLAGGLRNCVSIVIGVGGGNSFDMYVS